MLADGQGKLRLVDIGSMAARSIAKDLKRVASVILIEPLCAVFPVYPQSLLEWGAMEQFSKAVLFEEAWSDNYRGMLQQTGTQLGGGEVLVDPSAMAVAIDADSTKPQQRYVSLDRRPDHQNSAVTEGIWRVSTLRMTPSSLTALSHQYETAQMDERRPVSALRAAMQE